MSGDPEAGAARTFVVDASVLDGASIVMRVGGRAEGVVEVSFPDRARMQAFHDALAEGRRRPPASGTGVERFDVEARAEGGLLFEKRADGKLVLHSHHEAAVRSLEAEIAALKVENAALRGCNEGDRD